MSRALSLVFVFSFLACATPLFAQPASDPPVVGSSEAPLTGVSAFVENDVLYQLGRNEDRNYTGGFGIRVAGAIVERARLDAPLSLLDRVTGLERRLDRWALRRHSAMLFGTAFTPDRLNTAEVVVGDRPYASLVGVTVRKLSVNDETYDEAWSSELALAMLGLDVARSVQTALHRHLRRSSGKETPYDPIGWHHQISHGGEPTALYRVGYERRLFGAQSGPDVKKHFQVSGGGLASVGYYTNLTGSLRARLGCYRTDFWQFDPSAMNVSTQNARQDDETQAPPSELFLFAGVRPRAIAYNALLQGQFRDSVYTVTPRRFQLEWDLGVAAYISCLRLQVVWNAYAGRTAEFVGYERSRHTWGSVVATYVVGGGR